MSKFTASNGTKVWINRKGVVCAEDFQDSDKVWTQAIREFFLHERDKELGRWRWPEDPNIVVYPRDVGRWVEVIHEVYANRGVYSRGDFNSVPEWVEEAAEAYFLAHPVPKPWHDAQPGEVWLLTVGDADPVAWMCEEDSFGRHDRAININDLSITAGHRIWPEG